MEKQAIAPVQDRFCPQCDGRNPPDAAFCVECGTSLLAERRPVVAPQTPSRGPRCRSCHTLNPAQAVCCVNCGAHLAATPAANYPAPPFAASMAGAAPGGPVVQHIYVSASPSANDIPLIVRAIWFFFVGLWAGQVWLLIAWLLNLTLIGLPLGIWMLHLLPQVMTLRRLPQGLKIPPDRSSASFPVRALYFIFIGWWASLVWLQLAWVAAATVIGLPIAFAMFERTNTVLTLGES